MSGSGFGNTSLLDLFKMEAETHCAALSDGLLKLESNPGDTAPVDSLMRAAHSIKGAARIVGLDVIVPLAHAMEECFLAAKSGKESLTSGRVDQLLRCIDVLSEVRALSEPGLPAWVAAHSEQVSGLVASLKAPAPSGGGRSLPASAPIPPPVSPSGGEGVGAASAAPHPIAESVAPTSSLAAAATPPASAGVVRVDASTLSRMLFLAGEATVQASRFQDLRGAFAGVKARERALETSVQSLRETLGKHVEPGAGDDGAALAAVADAAGAMQTARVQQEARLDDAFRRMEELSGAMYTEVMRSRMRPFAEAVGGYPRMVRDLARELGKQVALKVEGESVHVDRDILQKLESPVTHLLRNSLDHGVETPEQRKAAGKSPTASVQLIARHQGGMLVIEVRDDGRGIDPEAVRRKVVEKNLVDAATAQRLTREELMEMLFLPGLSTRQDVTEISGRGVGLNVVQSMAQDVGGVVTLESEPGRGARFTLRLPVTRSVVRAALVRVAEELYAFPLSRLDRILLVRSEDVGTVQGRVQFSLEGRPVALVRAAELLGAALGGTTGETLCVLLIGRGEERCGIVVDRVFGEEDLVVRPLDPRLGRVPHIAAVAIRSDGLPVLVADVDDLWKAVKAAVEGGRRLGVPQPSDGAAGAKRSRILVVDDSITVREVERQLLTRHGYDVEVAVDGKDGYNMIRTGRFDLLVTDVDMPRMTGIELTRAVRKDARTANLPIVIVSYKDREQDRLAGMEAGANAYLAKSSFQDDSLIRMVRDLIGAPA